MDKKTHNKIAKKISRYLNRTGPGFISEQDQIFRNSDLIKAKKDESTIKTKQKFHVMQGTASILTFVSGFFDGSAWRSLTGFLITGRNGLQYSRLAKAKNSYELSGKEITNNLMSVGTGLPQYIQGIIDVEEPSDILTNKDFLPGAFLVAGYGGAVLNALVDRDGKQKEYEYNKNAYLRDLRRVMQDNGLVLHGTVDTSENFVERGKFAEKIKRSLEVIPPFLLKCRAVAQTATATIAGGVIYFKTGALDIASMLLMSAGAIQIGASSVMRAGNEKFSLKSKWRQENRDACFQHQMKQMKRMQGPRAPAFVGREVCIAKWTDVIETTGEPVLYKTAPLNFSDYVEVTPYDYRQEIEAPRDEAKIQKRIQEYNAA